jgi:hypothetical protein
VDLTTANYLHLREVEVFDYFTGVNVALGKWARMSTSWGASYPASNAVDGDKNNFFHTEHGLSWWRLDFGADVCVSKVKIYNRISDDSGVSNRLSNSRVSLRNANEDTLFSYSIGDATNKAEFEFGPSSSCDRLLQQFHRVDEELSIQGKWQGGSVTGVCKGWGTSKVRSIIHCSLSRCWASHCMRCALMLRCSFVTSSYLWSQCIVSSIILRAWVQMRTKLLLLMSLKNSLAVR